MIIANESLHEYPIATADGGRDVVLPPASSSGRIAMTADPERPIEGRDVDPEVLLHVRSTSDVVRYQPDPYHLKQLVTDLKNFRERASGAQVPHAFIRLVVQAIVDGFRRLDALPREHPFWDQ